MKMTNHDITLQRLRQQHLATPEFKKPADLVRWMGAVQAQDYSAAKWAVGQRLKTATEARLDEALDKWEIIRTHIMRPTWHFVAPEDLRWIQQLTAPRVKKLMVYNDNQWGLDTRIIHRSHKLLEKILRDKQQLTRYQIAPLLKEEGIPTDEYRIGSLLAHAELDGIICSGPRHGKQFSYVLIDEHVPPAKPRSKPEALAELALRYFSSHGPAQLQDFAWWSGLTVTESKAGLDAVKDQLAEMTIEGISYWTAPGKRRQTSTAEVKLLSAFDEFNVGYKKRDLQQLLLKKELAPMESLGYLIVTDGQITGTWKRTIKTKHIEVTCKHLLPLKKSDIPALSAAIEHYSLFTGMPVQLK
ncbi:winged helix DNA-binding domain-containing protein [Chitinophaga solisilvae]|uniref:winged helix DNA-binding domain-containing protein n=1 Tax=Chitinophaga solisilvae TaxID=1233460 RepID=UPI00136C4B9B|nr:winged helix DNA-binding domain-containing protein [Chitinophaga solisilvae]